MELIFDKSTTIKRKKNGKTIFALKTPDDDPVKVRMTIESKEPAELEKILKEKLDSPVEMTLKNL